MLGSLIALTHDSPKATKLGLRRVKEVNKADFEGVISADDEEAVALDESSRSCETCRRLPTARRTVPLSVWRQGAIDGVHRPARAEARAGRLHVRSLGVSPRSVVPSGPPWRLGVSEPLSPKEDPDEVAR